MDKIIESIKNNKKIVTIATAVVIIIGGAGIVLLNKKADNLTAAEIMTEMKKDKEINKMISADKEIKNIKDDPIEMFGENNRYISKVRFGDTTDPLITEDDECSSGSIEVFNNKEDLKIREEYLSYMHTQLKKNFPSDEFGDVLMFFGLNTEANTIYKKGNALLILSNSLDKTILEKYKEGFNKALENKSYDQVKTPDDKQINKLIKKDKAVIVEQINGVLNQLDPAFESIYEVVESEITKIAETQSETELNDLKSTLEYFNVKHCQEKYNQWQTQIQEIEKQIAEKKAAAEAEAAAKKAAEEAERQRQETLANNRHGAGMYKVGTDIPAGEYVIIGSGYFSINSDSSGTMASIIANDNFTNNSIVTVTDGQYLTVKKAAFYDININPDVSTSGAGMFKVGVHIPAGEYKLVATGSLSGYCEVDNSSKHSFDSIVSNDNFTGEKYITVKNGQYLKLSNCKISQ